MWTRTDRWRMQTKLTMESVCGGGGGAVSRWNSHWTSEIADASDSDNKRVIKLGITIAVADHLC